MPDVCKNSSAAMFADDKTLIASGKRIDNTLHVNVTHRSGLHVTK